MMNQEEIFGMHFILPLSSFLLCLAASWLFTAILIRLAPRLGLVDYPSDRKVHTRPTPRGGGLAIGAAVGLIALVGQTFLSATPEWQTGMSALHFLPILGWGSLVLLLGLIDDLRPLPWPLRLGVQTAVAVAAVLLTLPPAGPWWRAAAVFWVVAMTNAFNMLDNMDMLSGGVAFIAAGMLAAVGWLTSSVADAPDSAAESVLYLLLMGAVAGFLFWNRPPARIFMGDAGSTFLGFLLGLGTARLGMRTDGPAWSWAVPLCVAAVPCYDLVAVVALRLSQGRSPFHADKQHLSHRLVARGLSPPAAVGAIHLMGLASGASGLVLFLAPSAAAAALVLGQLAAWWGALAVIEFRQKVDSRQ
jgi:UDP-GlcNAc:undecaprenyl-phosphate GlcNAc-1-phosphate transferase